MTIEVVAHPASAELREPETVWAFTDDEDALGQLCIEGGSWLPLRVTGGGPDGKWETELVSPGDMTPGELKKYVGFLEGVGSE